ncbi:hypothetical protein QQU25_000536 [Salmonella enterica]|nr:hypothetical protein [Salmonella enterica]
MSHIFQKIDDILIESSKDMVDMYSFKSTGSKQELRDIFTKYRDSYTHVFFEFSNDEDAQKLLSIQDKNEFMAFGKKFGKRVTKEQCKILDILLYIWCMTEHVGLAQKMADDVYYNVLKKEFYENQGQFINSVIRSESNKEIAKKVRNKNYDRAISILRATWLRYPGAPQESLCKAVRKCLDDGVSVDRLKDWIKASGIRPPKPKRHTSFSLVIPDMV